MTPAPGQKAVRASCGLDVRFKAIRHSLIDTHRQDPNIGCHASDSTHDGVNCLHRCLSMLTCWHGSNLNACFGCCTTHLVHQQARKMGTQVVLQKSAGEQNVGVQGQTSQ